MSKIETDSADIILFPGQVFGEPTLQIDSDGFREHGKEAVVDRDLLIDMFRNFYNMSDQDITETHVIVRPPTTKDIVKLRGGFNATARVNIEDPNGDIAQAERGLVVINPPVPGTMLSKIYDFLNLTKYSDYTGVALHEASHRADKARGEIGTKAEKRLRKLGGSVLGAITGAWLSTKLGVVTGAAEQIPVYGDILDYAGEATKPLLRYFKASAFMGMAALGTSLGRGIGYRSIPTERRAFKNMANENALETYKDAITVKDLTE